MSVRLDAFGITDVGKVRKVNQDNFLIVDVRKSVEILNSSLSSNTLAHRFGRAVAELFVVADGVGGSTHGEVASEAAVSALLTYVSQAIGCFNEVSVDSEHALFEKLESTVRGVHEQLHKEHAGEFGNGPATTLTMVLLMWPRAYLVHVGDSRAYVRRKGRVQQLTRDQTFGDYMVSMGAWTEEQAKQSRPGAALASAIGGPEMTPIVGLVDLEPGDSLMLCTDGLTKHVQNDRIAEVLAKSDGAEATARQFVNEALDAGGTDNIAVIVVRAIEA